MRSKHAQESSAGVFAAGTRHSFTARTQDTLSVPLNASWESWTSLMLLILAQIPLSPSFIRQRRLRDTCRTPLWSSNPSVRCSTNLNLHQQWAATLSRVRSWVLNSFWMSSISLALLFSNDRSLSKSLKLSSAMVSWSIVCLMNRPSLLSQWVSSILSLFTLENT